MFLALLRNVPVDSIGVVCHLCDRPRCLEETHLVEGTHRLNTDHKIARGRLNPLRGVAVHSVKLTEDEVMEIRSAPLTHRELAQMYHVGITTVQAIRCGKAWKHLPDMTLDNSGESNYND